MNRLYQNVYNNCPIWMQNVLVSIYGYKLNKTRYGGNCPAYFQQCLENLDLSAAQLRTLQRNQLEDLVKLAAEKVPFYRQLFRRLKLTGFDIDKTDDIRRLPILEKESVRVCPEDFINEDYDVSSLLKIHTTGTTGTPLGIYCDSTARQRNYAFYDRFLWLNGLDHKGKKATLGGRIIIPSRQNKKPYWRYSCFQKNLLLSSYHLTETSIPDYIDKLIDYRPDIIDSYPSSLYSIARYALTNGPSLCGVAEGITTSAETLYPEQRDVIETVFGVPVCDQYGAAEMSIFVGQCREGSYHIHTDYGLVEFVRDNGTPAEAGEEADIVCTGFVNKVMPLIRYRIGDRGILSDRKCKCGSEFPVMDKLLGRSDDVIITPDGRRVGRLSPVMKGIPVIESQYVQKIREALDVQVVKAEGYSEDTEGALIDSLRKRLGNVIDINIHYVDSIERGKGGKLKSIISHVR